MRDYNEKYDSIQIEYAMIFMERIQYGESEGWLTAFQDLSIEDIHDVFDEALDDFHFNPDYEDYTYFQDFCDVWISSYQDKIERNEENE